MPSAQPKARPKAKPKAKKEPPRWWAAHVVLYLKESRARQATFLAEENVYLVRARGEAEARKRGASLGRAECVPDNSLRVNGRPAKIVFGGVRRVTWCAADPRSETKWPWVRKLRPGVEATFSTFVVRSRSDLDALIEGRSVSVRYEG